MNKKRKTLEGDEKNKIEIRKYDRRNIKEKKD